MPLIEKYNKRIFYIHIPRTGGRYITSLFRYNEFNVSLADMREKHNYTGYEIPHLWNPYYFEYEGVNEALHFTVVRNPFDRFKSALRNGNPPIRGEIDITNFESFVEFLGERIVKNKKVSFIPQFNYISEKTLVWRYEDGLGKSFLDWIHKNLGVRLKEGEFSYGCDLKEQYTTLSKWKKKEVCNVNVICEKGVEDLVREYYKKDYEFFNYKL